MKKLPIIGLIIGAIAAGFAIMKRKKAEPEPDMYNPNPSSANPNPGDTTPPA
jgi:hypothetical protein